MNEELKKQMRKILLERYELDIDQAKCYYSTQNFAFIFPDETFMIRVSMTPKKTRREIVSEMMWIDDLKQFKQTICEPNISAKGNLLEEFEIDGRTYRAGMFRTARGKVEPIANMSPMFFICVGDLMGTIHNVSTNEREIGIKYQRRTLAEQFTEKKEKTFSDLPKEVCRKIEEIETKVNSKGTELGKYGICHGDFHHNNFFVEANNVWLFDFDGCCYADYLYDAASFFQACFLHGYKAGEDCRKVFYDEIFPYFKIGYELNKECSKDYWNDIELFIAYRTAYSLMALEEIEECGVMEIEKAKTFFKEAIINENIFDGMTSAMKKFIG